MKVLTFVFYGADGDAAKELAVKIRKEGGNAQLRHTYAMVDGEKEPVDRIVTMPDVSPGDVARIKAVYGDIVAPLGAALPPPPPPPPAPDPLTNLAANWRDQDAAALKALAATVSGRSVENKAQAVQVIEAALAARSPK